MKNTILIIITILNLNGFGQLRNDDVYEMPEMNKGANRENIRIPDILGYHTLKCDFHIHTVFSDGKVWPDVRVDEAWKQGLDAIAITDHIEYRPYKNIVISDLNESYKIAKLHSESIGLIVIKGAEITRKKPLGHLNALFISNAISLDVKDSLDAIDSAKKQGAFIMWNHPGWPNDSCTMYPIHKQLIKDKKINGIEVFNYLEYYPISFDWFNEFNIPPMANSDVHESILNLYGNEKNSRPLTLVFASERTENGIKEALFSGRAVAFFKNILVGKPEYLKELVLASIKIKVINEKERIVEISNNSDITYSFKTGKELKSIPANKTIRMHLPKLNKIVVSNCFISKNKFLEIEISE